MKSESVLVLAVMVLLAGLSGPVSAQKYSGGTGQAISAAQEVDDNKAAESSEQERWIFDYSAMYSAVLAGDAARVRRLLKRAPSLISCTFGGEAKTTPLHWAASKGHVDVMKVLVENGADIEAKDRWQATALLKATDLAAVKLLLEHGADFQVTTESGSSVLHNAAYEGNIELMKLWIELGVDLEQQYSKGGSALLCAASRDHNDVVELLLEKGASIDSRDNRGETVLHKAAGAVVYLASGAGHSPRVTKLLLERGMEADVNDNAGETPLHKVAKRGDRCFNSAALLVGHGADVNVKNKEGWTPLHYASTDPNARLVGLLLERGADPNVRDKFRRTPLWLSVAKGGHTETVRLLLEAGAETGVIPANAEGTELHQAVYSARVDLVKLLLAHGADIEAGTRRPGYWPFRARWRGIYDRSPLHIAAHAAPVFQGRILRWPYRGERPRDIVVNSATRVEMVELLLSHGANIDAVDSEGKTPLDVAEEHGNEEIAAVLGTRGAKHGKELTQTEPKGAAR